MQNLLSAAICSWRLDKKAFAVPCLRQSSETALLLELSCEGSADGVGGVRREMTDSCRYCRYTCCFLEDKIENMKGQLITNT